MELKQQLRLTQQLVMTPQLQQAIRLLQLSRLELIDEVSKELDGNPILSEEESEARVPSTNGDAPQWPEQEVFRESADGRETGKAAKEVDWDKFLENRSLQQSAGGNRNSTGFEDLPPTYQNLTRPRSLNDHLLWQLQLGDFSDEERRFGELVIGNLNDDGLLDLHGVELPDGTRTPELTIEDLADEAGMDRDDAPLVLEMIQNLDPVGVAARDLRECLLVQARAYDIGSVALKIIEGHMANLEKKNYQAIVRDLKVDLNEVIEAAREIQRLESRPARDYVDHDDRSIAITPDVYVVKEGNEFVVVDNDRGLQHLHINDTLLRKLLKDPTAKEFVGEKLRNAQWLIRAIEQRRKTIIRVTEVIVEKQRDFFEKGVEYLKPMILRDVAEVVGMHESTISRVTANKYAHTPQGLLELKYFFNSSIRRVADEDIASEAVKHAIRHLVDVEDKRNPQSDQTLVRSLETSLGIRIARRTVAKYRDVMCILPSSRRKQLF